MKKIFYKYEDKINCKCLVICKHTKEKEVGIGSGFCRLFCSYSIFDTNDFVLCNHPRLPEKENDHVEFLLEAINKSYITKRDIEEQSSEFGSNPMLEAINMYEYEHNINQPTDAKEKQ